jgi:selenocysteine lyase/cysteine desulfurase
VLIAADCFPSLHFMLAHLAPRFGFALVTVPHREGANWVTDDDFIATWGPEVALAILTWVSSTSSHRIDVERLVAHGRRVGSLVALDVTQGIGILPFDAVASGVDFAASTSLKWLCGVPGAGTAFMAPDLLARLEPGRAGWFSQPDPMNWDLDSFRFAPDARRFDNGTPSYLPFIASVPGLEWHASVGAGPLRAHNLDLSHGLMEIAHRRRLRLVSPRDDGERGGTIVIEVPGKTTPDALRRRLEADGLFCDTRGSRMRWSPGLVTTREALEQLDRTLQAALT